LFRVVEKARVRLIFVEPISGAIKRVANKTKKNTESVFI